MKKLLLLVLSLLPLPVMSQVWEEFYKFNVREGSSFYEFSRDIDLQSIIRRGDYHYVNIRYWSDYPGSRTTSSNQSIYTTRISCKEQTVQNVGHNRGGSKGILYTRFPNGEWKYKILDNWETTSTDHMDVLLKYICN